MAILRRERELSERTLVISIALVEPDKATLRRACARATPSRARPRSCSSTASPRPPARRPSRISDDRLLEFRVVEGRQAAIIGEEYEACEQLVKAHPDFAAALARRGITDQTLVCVDPDPGRDVVPRRARRAGGSAAGSSWMRPSPGAIRTGGRSRASSRSSTSTGARSSASTTTASCPSRPRLGEYRTGQTGPERDGHAPDRGRAAGGRELHGRRQPDPLAGLVVPRRLDDARRPRPARSSPTTTATSGARSCTARRSARWRCPYGDPSPSRYIQCPFDIGENLIGSFANALELGCDCLGLDPLLRRRRVQRSGRAGHAPQRDLPARGGRRPALEALGLPHRRHRGAALAPARDQLHHDDRQLRLRLLLDALPRRHDRARDQAHGDRRDRRRPAGRAARARNADRRGPLRDEPPALLQRAARLRPRRRAQRRLRGAHGGLAAGPGNPIGTRVRGRAHAAAQRGGGAAADRPALLARAGSSSTTSARTRPARRSATASCRARTACRTCRRTRSSASAPASPSSTSGSRRFHADERYAAGEYPNLHPGGAGLPEFVADDEGIVDEDIVLWYSLGHNHLPRTEDWPIMPVWKMGFMLKPSGFFDRNPTLDVPPPRSSHSCCHGADAQ